MPMRAKNSKSKYGTVSLPMPLIDKIKAQIENTGMNSVSAYVTFVLRQILSSSEDKKNTVIDNKSEEELKRRLKSLGYY